MRLSQCWRILSLCQSQVAAGSINLNGTLTVEVQRPGGETAMADIVRLVEEAQSREAPVQRLADKVIHSFLQQLDRVFYSCNFAVEISKIRYCYKTSILYRGAQGLAWVGVGPKVCLEPTQLDIGQIHLSVGIPITFIFF